MENATLVFLPGTHTIESSIEIGNLTSLTLLGDPAYLPQITSRISCTQRASLGFHQIENLFINALGIISCGTDFHGAAVVAELVQSMTISNCLFQNNTNVIDFTGGALAVVFSTLAVFQTTFQGNSAFVGGGCYIRNSIVNFTRNQFENNSAFYGGGMAVVNNSVGTFAENVFLTNVAHSGGGGVDVFSNSTASFLNNTLMKNIAALDGGAVYNELESSVEFKGNTFIDNSAMNGGGIAIQYDSTGDFTGNTFINNSNSDTWEVEIDTTSTATFTNNNFINSTGYAVYGSAINASSIYYIRPLPDTPCPESPCHTLSDFLRLADQYFTLNTTLVLLPGGHLLDDKLLVRDISVLTLIGGDDSSSSLSANASKIMCASMTVFFHFQNISDVTINAVSFVSCGNAYNSSAMTLLVLHYVSISNCMFQNSTGGALSVMQTDTLVLTHSSFIFQLQLVVVYMLFQYIMHFLLITISQAILLAVLVEQLTCSQVLQLLKVTLLS